MHHGSSSYNVKVKQCACALKGCASRFLASPPKSLIRATESLKLISLLCPSLLLLIAGCATVVEKSIQLPDEFAVNAERYSLKSPSWRYPGAVFSHDMGEYDTSALKVGQVITTDRNHTAKSFDDSSLLDWLVSRELPAREIIEYDVTQNQSYSYGIRKNEMVIGSSKCESFRLTLQEIEKNNNLSGSRQLNDFIHLTRKKTLLVCAIDLHNKQWELILKLEKDHPASLELKAQDVVYRIEEISDVYAVLKDKKGQTREHDLSKKFTSFAGAGVFNNNGQQIAAVSFIGDLNNIWIDKQESMAVQELMLTAGYALILNNWLDDNWREPLDTDRT